MSTTQTRHRPTTRRRSLVLLLAVAVLVGFAAIAAATGFAGNGQDESPGAPGITPLPHSHHDPARSDYRAPGVATDG